MENAAWALARLQAEDDYAEEESSLAIDTTTGVPQLRTSRSSVLDGFSAYLASLFPFLSWAGRYNTTWLASDIVAGITVGAVVVPQGMAYASLAKLDPQYGLYSSIVGVMVYWIFGTSKDISIGPVAVLSTVVGNVVNNINSPGEIEIDAHIIASALSVVTGCVVLTLGLLRCGWLVDLISITSLSAFMTGSAITIVTSQVPALLGLTGFSNRRAPYEVFINIISNIDGADMNAVVGLTALFILYVLKSGLATAMKWSDNHKHLLSLLNTMRTVFIIIAFTVLSYLVNASRGSDPVFAILGTVPRGLQGVGVPVVSRDLIDKMAPYLPAAVVVMVVEHIAIAKSFGRASGYTIDPSQEMVAIGATNIFGPFLGGYASTGSFSRTALQAKAGARSPATGVVTGVVVLLAVQLLTSVFFYIPCAVLSAVIIHAVGDLITPLSTLRQFWLISPIELMIYAVGVVVSLLRSIEEGLYATVLLSVFTTLCRTTTQKLFPKRAATLSTNSEDGKPADEPYGTFSTTGLKHVENVISYKTSVAGTIKHQFRGDLNYMSSRAAIDSLIASIRTRTRPAIDQSAQNQADRLWNEDPLAEIQIESVDGDALPVLAGVELDFTLVDHIDATAAQRLLDAKQELNSRAFPQTVAWSVSGARSHSARQVQQLLSSSKA